MVGTKQEIGKRLEIQRCNKKDWGNGKGKTRIEKIWHTGKKAKITARGRQQKRTEKRTLQSQLGAFFLWAIFRVQLMKEM